jgi:prevent-host-death family protein
MSMKAFSFSDLSRRSGDVLDAALAGPVSLVKRGKTKVVMLPVEQYSTLVDRARANTAFTLDTATDEDIEALTEAFEDIAANGNKETG